MAEWIACDRNRRGREATFSASNLVEARAIATRQLRIPSEQLHCAVVAEGESIAAARERVRREAEEGLRRAVRAQVEVIDGSGATRRGKVGGS